MTLPNYYIILGTLFIAVGGLMATHGWNMRSDFIKKNSMIKAVAAEYLVYEAVIHDKKFTETDEKKLSKFVIYPRFQTTVLESVIASGLFSGKEDKELFTRAVNLHELIQEINKRLEITESNMMANAQSIKSWREKVRDGALRKSVLAKLVRFADLLANKYRVDFKDICFIPLEEDLKHNKKIQPTQKTRG